MSDTIISVAAEPHWVEVSREELRRRQYALGSLIGKLASKNNLAAVPVVNADEMRLLEEVWQMHVELLR